MDGIISGVSISHDRATLEQLETIRRESPADALVDLLENPSVEEAFVIQTCNRVEAYVVTQDTTAGRAVLDAWVGDVPTELQRTLDHEGSLRHLLRVGAGLESLVLGEDQILGQLRDAYETAREHGGIGPLLDEGVTKAIRVGERARTETAINEGVVSLASAAVRLADEKCGLDGATTVVVGAGEMGRIAAKRLADRVETLVVANRTCSSAREVVDSVEPTETDLTVRELHSVPETLGRADIVISATGSPDHVVDQEAFEGIGETFVVDIANPRDVPPAVDDHDHLDVYDLDGLEAVTEKTRQMRRNAASAVEAIVDEEFERLLVQYKRQRADSVISAMYEGAERVKTDELETAFEKLDLDESEREVVESMADTIVSQLLANPTSSLRDAAENDDWETIHTALELFNPHLSAADVDDVRSSAVSVPEATDSEAGQSDETIGDVSE